jgi:hypothetical protein
MRYASFDFTYSAHVRAEDFGHENGSVLLLEVLQNRHQGPADRQPRSIQGVDKLRSLFSLGAVTDIGPPRLEILEVAAG